MKTITIKRGLDLPVQGEPKQVIRDGAPVRHVALVGDDYIGLKPTMLVQEGDRVKLGQPVFTDKKNPGYNFTAPGAGVVKGVYRGAKRKFESLVIELDGEETVSYDHLANTSPSDHLPETIRETLRESGLWTSLRARPFGKVASPEQTPASLFVTCMDTQPLAADPLTVLSGKEDIFTTGLKILRQMLQVPIHLCFAPGVQQQDLGKMDGVTRWQFTGPHPAGLVSTHIHFIDPVHEGKEVWHLDYQDVCAIGHLFSHGELMTETVVALGGEAFQEPSLLRTRRGASLAELCQPERLDTGGHRLLSGSVLDGRPYAEINGYLGRYHRQISSVQEGSGRSLFGWMVPGSDRFSATRLFLSSFVGKQNPLSFLTAVWGGDRAIFPLDVYNRVMPLDIIALSLLKSLAVGDTEKSAALGCLELVEEDLALCSFVCPGKNEFGPMLRDVLNTIEQGG